MMDQSDKSLVDRLEQVPQRLARALEGQTSAALQQVAEPQGWSAVDILAHVRASDDIIAYRVYTILARDNPPMPGYDERRWAEVARYAQLPIQDSLAAFTQKRAELVQMLRHILPGDWDRRGTHEVSGPLTLRAVAAFLLEHDEEHCAQLEEIKGGVG